MNDYIKTMRSLIGQETLLTVGCGAMIEDTAGRILLQRKRDLGTWGLPGGLMEIGETFEETVKREVLEETNLIILQPLRLFGIYSGKDGFAQYANGDKVFSVQIIFHVTAYKGNIQANEESAQLQFVHKTELPANINPHQAPFIMDWVNGIQTPVIR